jgi:small-conductance mechanosensitive channel
MRLPLWAAALIVLVATGYAVPYLLLSGTESWSGAFLFWIVFGVFVWGILVGRVARWDVAAPPRPAPEAEGRRP